MKYSPNAFLNGSIFDGFFVDLTVPLTLNDPSFKKERHVYAPTYPEIPVIVTIGLPSIILILNRIIYRNI